MALGPRGRGQPGRSEIVQFGRPIRSRRYRLSAVLLACLVAAAVALVTVRPGSHSGAASPAPMTVTGFGQPIPGLRAGWQLIGLDGSGVVAVQFSRGRVVHTNIPGLSRDGLVSLVPAPGEVLVRPVDNGPGYVVPDDEPAQSLTGALAHGGLLLPGPTAAEQWLDSHDFNLMLVGPGGKPEQAHLPESGLVRANQMPLISDGRGGFILTGESGSVYDANHGTLRIVNALPLAVGPRNWLGLQCDIGSCRNVVISAATGVSRPLPGAASYTNPWPWQPLPGVVSPDGTAAAIVVPGSSEGPARLYLVRLNSGAAVRVQVPVAPDSSSHSLTWSPDSRWLFVVTAHGTLEIVDARTGRPQHQSFGLSGLSQIVFQPAGD